MIGRLDKRFHRNNRSTFPALLTDGWLIYPVNHVHFLLKNWELAQYLVEKKKTFDFSKPAYILGRQDSDVIMQRILSISYRIGIK